MQNVPFGRDASRGQSGASVLERQTVHIPDVLADPEFTLGRMRRKLGEYRTVLGVPLLREGASIGVIVLARTEVAAVHRQADRAGHHLRRPGGDRDRERAAVRRGAGAHARTHANRCSSRPPPPTCSRSSAARPSICKPCSIRWSNRRPGCATPTWRRITRQRDGVFYRARAYGFSTEFMDCVRDTSRSSPERGSATGRALLRGHGHPYPRRAGRSGATPVPRHRGWAVSAPCSAFRCCARASRSACWR